jgi:hypothetical protein
MVEFVLDPLDPVEKAGFSHSRRMSHLADNRHQRRRPIGSRWPASYRGATETKIKFEARTFFLRTSLSTERDPFFGRIRVAITAPNKIG